MNKTKYYEGCTRYFLEITQQDIDDSLNATGYIPPHFVAIQRQFKRNVPLPYVSSRLSWMIMDWDCGMLDTFKPGKYAIWIK